MYARLFTVLKSDLFKSTGLLFTSSIIANVIILIGFLFLAKLFSTSTLGELYLFTSYSGIMTMLVLAGYHHAIPLMSNIEIERVVSNSAILIIITSTIAALPLYFINYWFILIFSITYNTVIQIAEMVMVRDQRILHISILRILVPCILYMSCILSYFIFGNKPFYLILAQTIAGSLMALLYWYVAISKYLKRTKYQETWLVLKKYKKFPKFIAPGMIFNTFAYNLPIIVAGQYFSTSIAANYNMAFKITFSPMQMLGSALTQSYTGKLSQFKTGGKNIFTGYIKLRTALFATSIAAGLFIYYFVPLFIEVFLDPEWELSAQFSVILIPLMIVMIGIAPLTTLFQFTDNQRYIFIVHLLSAIISIAAFSLAILYNDFILGVILFSVMMTLRYVFIIIKLNKLSNESKKTI